MLSQSHIRGLLQSIEPSYENRIATTFADIIDGSHNVTNYGANFVKDSGNIDGGAVAFNGVSTYCEMPTFALNTFTLELKYRTGITSTHYIMSKGSGSTNQFLIAITSTAVTISLAVGGVDCFRAVTNVTTNDNQWHTLKYTTNRTTQKLYIDNVERSLVTNTLTATNDTLSNVFWFGRLRNTNTYYKFEVSDFKISTSYDDISSPVIDVPFDFSNSTLSDILYDKSGNGNHATVNGGTWTADRFGRANRAILLDGVDDYIDLGLANYQGDLGVLISAKIISFAAGDRILNKSYQNDANFPPSLSLRIGTSNTFNYRHYYSAGNLVNGSGLSSFLLDGYSMFYLGLKGGSNIVHGVNGNQLVNVNSNITGNFTTGYPLLLGTINVTTTALNPNMAIDRVMLFNRYLSGHELSKLANRLKIGDMNK